MVNENLRFGLLRLRKSLARKRESCLEAALLAVRRICFLWPVFFVGLAAVLLVSFLLSSTKFFLHPWIFWTFLVVGACWLTRAIIASIVFPGSLFLFQRFTERSIQSELAPRFSQSTSRVALLFDSLSKQPDGVTIRSPTVTAADLGLVDHLASVLKTQISDLADAELTASLMTTAAVAAELKNSLENAKFTLNNSSSLTFFQFLEALASHGTTDVRCVKVAPAPQDGISSSEFCRKIATSARVLESESLKAIVPITPTVDPRASMFKRTLEYFYTITSIVKEPTFGSLAYIRAELRIAKFGVQFWLRRGTSSLDCAILVPPTFTSSKSPQVEAFLSALESLQGTEEQRNLFLDNSGPRFPSTIPALKEWCIHALKLRLRRLRELLPRLRAPVARIRDKAFGEGLDLWKGPSFSCPGSGEDGVAAGGGAESLPVVIFCNPNAGFYEMSFYASSTVDLYLSSGIPVVVFNYGGFGRSSGRPSLRNIGADCVGIIDFLRSHFGIEKMGLHGRSIGGSAVTHAAHVRPQLIRWLCIDRGFSDLCSTADMMLGTWTNIPLKLFREDQDNVNLFLQSRTDGQCHKVVCCDGRDGIIHNLASLKAGVAMKLAAQRWRGRRRLSMSVPTEDAQPSKSGNASARDLRTSRGFEPPLGARISELAVGAERGEEDEFIAAYEYLSCLVLHFQGTRVGQYSPALMWQIRKWLSDFSLTCACNETNVESREAMLLTNFAAASDNQAWYWLKEALQEIYADLQTLMAVLACGLNSGGQSLEAFMLVNSVRDPVESDLATSRRHRRKALGSFLAGIGAWGSLPASEELDAGSIFAAALQLPFTITTDTPLTLYSRAFEGGTTAKEGHGPHDLHHWMRQGAVTITKLAAKEFQKKIQKFESSVAGMRNTEAKHSKNEWRILADASVAAASQLQAFLLKLERCVEADATEEGGAVLSSQTPRPADVTGHLLPLRCGHNGEASPDEMAMLKWHLRQSPLGQP